MQFVNGIGLDRIIERLKEADGIINVDEIRVQQTQQPPQQEKLSNEALRRTGEVSSAEQESRRRLTRTSWSNFAKVAMQATQALRCAHAAGILHNDIKPGNLLLDGEGRIWVSDFGLSQPISPVGQKSLDRTISGTLKYMAPERLLGQQSAACDLYSLGATLYELCLQRPVFDHPDRDELVRMIMEEEPQRARTICYDIPRGLETIITNCLAKHPTDRYATADAMLSDLLRYSKDQSVSSTYRSSFSGFFRAIRQSMRKRKAP
jgi:serine/threonine protein kinase